MTAFPSGSMLNRACCRVKETSLTFTPQGLNVLTLHRQGRHCGAALARVQSEAPWMDGRSGRAGQTDWRST
jgi:hypothetical protein